MSELLIDMRAWRQFVVLADELHFGRAAQRLNMTQPPLTQAIAGLEQKLGMRLFDRTQRSVQLTSAGQVLLPQVQEVLARALALPTQARAAAEGEMGCLRLGFVSTAGFDLLPPWVRAFRLQCPEVRLELFEATGDVQLNMLERGELDAGIFLHSPGMAPQGYASALLQGAPMVLALPEQHVLAQEGRALSAQAVDVLPAVSVDVLWDEPLVSFPRRILPTMHDAIFALYRSVGRTPQVVQEAIQMQTIVNLVSAGLGLAWVPRSVMQFQRPGVVYRQVQVAPGMLCPAGETSLVWNAAHCPPVLSRFRAAEPERADRDAV